MALSIILPSAPAKIKEMLKINPKGFFLSDNETRNLNIFEFDVSEIEYSFIDKKTHQIGIYDCSPEFYESGQDKVKRASEAYDLFYKTDSFDPKQYFISKTL